MFVWVIYDIKLNKTRNRVIKQCKKYGLYRVQKSVFFGDIDLKALGSLKVLIRYIIDFKEDSVYVFPMTKKHLDEARFIGLSFDKSLVTGQTESIFF
ncbi:CRISPR-associated endonuclease Cas2 [Romboutsia maritimum]|uniref:CRISPR-associated endoribonuclease Cas2 n=1 Tax=Romboutsia maritimum TaxID=2020948 RepID=A0A255IFP5_9FIRM|nr:CRISPR-associated endonuclease Cas2 [Romboutsia maritimum]RDY23799.1 CRISPR-associated endonuclease Cas2 [Romboutsia maritimum]